MKTQKKIAVINDLSGFGRCSLTVSLPILSAMGVQTCPVPTSILSNHTGYPTYFFDDYTEKLPFYIEQWKTLNLTFDGILVGFLGSEKQIDIVEDFLSHFGSKKDTKVILDPIMGDHGKTYATFTPALCARMKQLAKHADILTPNLTEACILTDTPYQEQPSRRQLQQILSRLAALCPGRITITGVNSGTYLTNMIYDPHDASTVFLRKKRISAERCGTGDVFSAVVAGSILQGLSLREAVKKAADFVSLSLKETAGYDIAASDGVVFEPLLSYLTSSFSTQRLR